MTFILCEQAFTSKFQTSHLTKVQQPPKYSLRFLRWFCREDYIDEIEGDLIELFELRMAESPSKARRRFVWDVIKSFRVINFKKLKIIIMFKSMFYHTFKTGFRQMARNKLYTVINIAGLSISLVVFFLIGLYAYDEFSYDKFHPEYEKVYRVLKSDAEETDKWAYNPPALAPSLHETFPEVTNYARLFFMNYADSYYGEQNLAMTKGYVVDTSFFEMFQFPVVEGKKIGLLDERSNLVISKNIADTYFPNASPVGESIKISGREFVVSSVVAVPKNSHFDFDFAVNIRSMIREETLNTWPQSFLYSYIKADIRDKKGFEQKISDHLHKNDPDMESVFLKAQPVADIHLDPNVNGQISVSGNGFYIKVFLGAGIIILLIACINFMNLILGRVGQRVKEVGVRKINGANRSTIVFQFMGEALLIVLISLIIASVSFTQLLSSLNVLTGKSYTLNFVLNTFPVHEIGIGSLLIIAFLTIASSIYPSIVISSIKPISMMRGWVSVKIGSISLSRVLNTFQFAISMILIIGSLIVLKQLNYLNDKPLGWDKDNLVAIQLKSGMFKQFEPFKNELLKNESVSHMSWASELPIDVRTGGAIEFEGMNPEKQYIAYYMNGGEDFYETLGLNALEGYPFREIKDESKKQYVINESLMKYLQEEWGPDVSPIGKILDEGVIVGVVENYHWQPLTREIAPILYGIEADDNYGSPGWFMVRLKDGQLKNGMTDLEKAYAKVYPDLTFNYEFVDEKVAALYHAEQNTSKVLNIFSGLAIFISCLGLFGLAYQAINNKLKSLSIRKVMGATPVQLFKTFARNFGVVLLIAMVIAIPAAYFLIEQWLSNFAYRIDIDIFSFIWSMIGVAAVVLFTLLLQFRKILVTNPASILRDE